MTTDYPSQLGWNEWQSQGDNSGGFEMVRHPVTHNPFWEVVTRPNTAQYDQYAQYDPSKNVLEWQHLKKMAQMHQGMGGLLDEEKALLSRIHARGQLYKLKLLGDFALA